MIEHRVTIKWNEFMDTPLEFIPAALRQKLLDGGFKLKPSRLKVFLTEQELQDQLEGTIYTLDTFDSRTFVQRLGEELGCTTPS